jgi:hypothetical protein
MEMVQLFKAINMTSVILTLIAILTLFAKIIHEENIKKTKVSQIHGAQPGIIITGLGDEPQKIENLSESELDKLVSIIKSTGSRREKANNDAE